MRSLFISSCAPFPPDRGDRIRSYYTSMALMKEFEVDAVYFYRKEKTSSIDVDEFDARSMRLLPLNSLEMLFNRMKWHKRGLPVLIKMTYASRIRENIETLLKGNYDFVFAQGIRAAPFVKSFRGPKFIDLVDAVSMHLERRSYYAENPFNRFYINTNNKGLIDYERYIVNIYDKTFLSSPVDISYIDSEFRYREKIILLPNGVDFSIFKPTGVQNGIKRRLFFHGNMSGYNVDAVNYFLEEIMPLIIREEDVDLNLIGFIPDRYRKKWSGRNTRIIGYVDNIASEIAKMDIMVAPFRIASGIQNKVLEAMASGKPVVCTPLINAAIGAKNEEQICVAANASEFKEYVLRLIRDNAFYEKISKNARDFVEKNHSWDSYIKIVVDTIKDVLDICKEKGQTFNI